jgi:hypothetical protein
VRTPTWRRLLASALLLIVPAIGGAQLAAHIRDAADAGARWTENTTLRARVHDHRVCVLLDHSRELLATGAFERVVIPAPVSDAGPDLHDRRSDSSEVYEVRPRAPPHLS